MHTVTIGYVAKRVQHTMAELAMDMPFEKVELRAWYDKSKDAFIVAAGDKILREIPVSEIASEAEVADWHNKKFRNDHVEETHKFARTFNTVDHGMHSCPTLSNDCLRPEAELVDHNQSPTDLKLFEGGNVTVRSLIIHLNDRHKWTYSQIADWLDTLPKPVLVKE